MNLLDEDLEGLDHEKFDDFKLYKFLNGVYTIHDSMESKTNFVEKPRRRSDLDFLYRSTLPF